jgi:hypothetical protein
MIHSNLRFVLAAIICKLVFGSIPTLKSDFSNSSSQFLAIVSDDPRVKLTLLKEEVLQSTELFFRKAFQTTGRFCGTCRIAVENSTVAQVATAILPGEHPIFVKQSPLAIASVNAIDFTLRPAGAYSLEPKQKGEI